VSSERDSVSDLLSLERRGALSESAQGRLQEALEASEELRVLHEAGLAFDAEAPVLAGDEARIERMARRVRQGTRSVRLSPRVLQAAQSLALGALIAGVAIAAIELSRWHPRASTETTHSAASALTSHTPSLAGDQRLVPVTPEPAVSEAPPEKIPTPTLIRPNAAGPANAAALLGSAAASNAKQGSDSAASATPAPPSSSSASFADAPEALLAAKYKSASELFADANKARVQGDAKNAIAISEQLEATFPNSSEGITTHLSLGVLYLQQGQASRALTEFKTYRHIGSSALFAEALWGEEQALQQLGQVTEERAVLEELLANYPRSAYAGAAQKRLAALNH
jgi:TolA-binding protein